MPITNPEATNFVDHFRQTMEKLRNLQIQATEDIVQWNGGINAHFAGQDTEVVQDQNVDHHPVTGADVTNSITRIMQVADGAGGFESGGGLNGANMMDAPLKLVVKTVTGPSD